LSLATGVTMISKAQGCEEMRKTAGRTQGAVAFGRALSAQSQESSSNDKDKAPGCEEMRKTAGRAQGAVEFGCMLSAQSQESSSNDDKDKTQGCEEMRKTAGRAQGAVEFGCMSSVNSQESSTNDDKDDDNSNAHASEIPLEKAFLDRKFKSESESKLPPEHINLWKNMYRKKTNHLAKTVSWRPHSRGVD